MNIARKIYNLSHPVVGEVWMLHRVVEQRSAAPEQRCLEVEASWLEQQIAARRAQGWHFVSLDAMQGRRWIVLTFDDGYADNYTLALPLLRRLEVPFAVYVATDYIDNQAEMWWYAGQRLALSREQLSALAAEPLCTIGAHGTSHRKLAGLPPEVQRREAEQSRRELEVITGQAVRHFSMPHGSYDEPLLTELRRQGYLTAARSWGGAVRRGFERMPLSRVEIVQP